MTMKISPEKIPALIEWIERNWHKKTALILSILIVFVVSYWVIGFILKDSNYKLINEYLWLIQLSFGTLFSFIITILWFNSNKYPRRKNNSLIGLVIAIRSNTEKAKRVQQDVVDKFRQIISKVQSADIIDLIVLRDVHAKRVIDKRSAIEISDKCNAHFVVWGKSLSYEHDASEQYKFDPDFLVRHKPLEPQQRNLIVRAFEESCNNRQWEFLEKDVFKGINTTAENIREIAFYVIGIAAFLSSDYETSLKLHNDLYQLLESDSSERKKLILLYKRLKLWISDSYMLLSISSYYEKKDPKDAYSLIEKSLNFHPNHQGAMTCKAQYEFSLGRTGPAKNTIKQIESLIKKEGSSGDAWLYSKAFLYFFDEDYEKGSIAYKRAFDGKVSERVVDSVVLFIQEYLVENPQKIQFLYVLGVLFYLKKMNLPEALIQFEEFILLSDGNKNFIKPRDKARKYTEEIKSKLEIKED